MKLICGKCRTEQDMEKRIVRDTYTFYCPNCDDLISKHSVKPSLPNQSHSQQVSSSKRQTSNRSDVGVAPVIKPSDMQLDANSGADTSSQSPLKNQKGGKG